MRVSYFGLAAIVQAAVPVLLFAQTTPVGVEFQVTVYTYGGQLQPRACRAASGALPAASGRAGNSSRSPGRDRDQAAVAAAPYPRTTPNRSRRRRRT